jgi:SAM-dependent methyltransferase
MTDVSIAAQTWTSLLGSEFAETHRALDWYGAPGIKEYATKLAGGDWKIHARDAYLVDLAAKRRAAGASGLSMVSFGCGAGDTEKLCLDLGWPIASLTCLELNPTLLAAAETTLAPYDIEKTFLPFDYDDVSGLQLGEFDLAFFCGSLHHCTNVEQFLPFLNGCLKLDSLVLGYDYFGPCRFQPQFEILPIIQALYKLLPERLKLNLATGVVESDFSPPLFQHITAHDPSESSRSSDLRSLFFGNFPVLEYRPMGGTLLSPILTLKSGNYTSPDDLAFLNMMMLFEKTLIERGIIPSNDLYFVCGKSHRI